MCCSCSSISCTSSSPCSTSVVCTGARARPNIQAAAVVARWNVVGLGGLGSGARDFSVGGRTNWPPENQEPGAPSGQRCGQGPRAGGEVGPGFRGLPDVA